MRENRGWTRTETGQPRKGPCDEGKAEGLSHDAAGRDVSGSLVTAPGPRSQRTGEEDE